MENEVKDNVINFKDLKPFTLAFKKPYDQKEGAFLKFFIYKSLNSITITLLVSSLLIFSFSYLDYILYPKTYHYFWFLRLIVGSIILISTLFLKIGFIKEKYQQLVLFLLMLLAGFSINAMFVIDSSRYVEFYFAGLMLILFTGFTFIRLRFPLAFLSGLLIIITMEYITYFIAEFSFKVIIIENYFVVSSFILGAVAGYSLELNQRREFIMQNRLQNQKNTISYQNENLEKMVLERTEELHKANIELRNEIREREILEKAEQKHKKNVYHLAKSAMKFLETSIEEDIYKNIGETISSFSGNSIVVVSQIDQEKEILNVKSINGMGKIQSKIFAMLEYNIFNTPQPLPPDLIDCYKEGKICLLDLSLYEFLLKKVPNHICDTIQSLLKIRKIFSVGFMWNNILYGNAAILLQDQDKLDNVELIEAYSMQASIALQNRFAEKRVIENEKWYKKILQEQGEGIIIADFEENIIFCNPMAEKIFNVESDTLAGRNLKEFLLQEDFESILEKTQKRIQGKTSKYEVRLKNGDNSYKYLLVTATPIQKGNQFTGTLAIFRDITEQKGYEKEIRNSLDEKQILLKEVHHRVKNNMQIISSLLRMQARSCNNPEIINQLVTSQNRVQSMAIIHEKLYQSEDFTFINFRNYIDQLIDHLFMTYNNDISKVKILNKIKDVKLNINLAIPCGLIANEIITNSLKYAFPGDTKGTIIIEFDNQESENILKISDNGLGLPDNFNFENLNTLGMQIISTLVKQIHGDIDIISEGGLTHIITFENTRLKTFSSNIPT